jgi:hypothetical protein
MLLTPCTTLGCKGLAVLSSNTEGSHYALCPICGQTHPVTEDEIERAKENNHRRLER